MPDDFFGEVVAAAVRVKTGSACPPSVDELIAFCTGRLAKFKVPKYVRFVADFPMTASGKIQKYKLREEHEKKLTVESQRSTVVNSS